MPLIGVVYSLNQSCVRRVIIPDRDEQLQDPAWIGPGEGIITYDAKLKTSPEEQLKLALGKDPIDDHCAVIDALGNIVTQIKADPAIDTHPDGDLVATGGPVPPETTYNAKTKVFTLEIPEKITPAGTVIKGGEVLAEDLVETAKTVTLTVDATGKQTKIITEDVAAIAVNR